MRVTACLHTATLAIGLAASAGPSALAEGRGRDEAHAARHARTGESRLSPARDAALAAGILAALADAAVPTGPMPAIAAVTPSDLDGAAPVDTASSVAFDVRLAELVATKGSEDTVAAPPLTIAIGEPTPHATWPTRGAVAIASAGMPDAASARRSATLQQLGAHLGELAACLDGETRRHPHHGANLRLRIVLEEDHPALAIVDERTPVEPGLAACIVGVARRWDITAPAGGLVARYRVSAHLARRDASAEGGVTLAERAPTPEVELLP